MDKIHIAILYGGRSGEHEVSLHSAASIMNNLDFDRYQPVLIGINRKGEWFYQGSDTFEHGRSSLLIKENADAKVSMHPSTGFWVGKTKLKIDVVFPVLHGTFGEDGTVQGVLEIADIPYIGAGVTGSAVGMDKEKAKKIWRQDNLPVVPFIAIDRSEYLRDETTLHARLKAEGLTFPLFVKPVNTGSSVGITRVAAVEEVPQAVRYAFRFDSRVLIEEGIDAREIECSVVGNEEPKAFTPGEIKSSHEFYSYKAKYQDEQGTDLLIPAPISTGIAEKIKNFAVKAYTAVSAEGMSRVDFFLEKNTSRIFINEINTIPGFTSISMFPKMCEASGLNFPILLDNLVDLAQEKYAKSKNKEFTYQ
jgi:D-alanine-D-alanine ligase